MWVVAVKLSMQQHRVVELCKRVIRFLTLVWQAKISGVIASNCADLVGDCGANDLTYRIKCFFVSHKKKNNFMYFFLL